jgi:hypothetical protein
MEGLLVQRAGLFTERPRRIDVVGGIRPIVI